MLHVLPMQKIVKKEIQTKLIVIEENAEEITVIRLDIDKKQLLNFINCHLSAVKVADSGISDLPTVRKYEDYVFIRKGAGYKKVAVREIVYLEAARNYCDIHLEGGVCFNVSMPMNEVYEYLNPEHFKRVHRSFIVHLEHVDTYIGNMLLLSDGKEIVIGREYRDMISKDFTCIGSRKRVKEKNGK